MQAALAVKKHLTPFEEYFINTYKVVKPDKLMCNKV